MSDPFTPPGFTPDYRAAIVQWALGVAVIVAGLFHTQINLSPLSTDIVMVVGTLLVGAGGVVYHLERQNHHVSVRTAETAMAGYLRSQVPSLIGDVTDLKSNVPKVNDRLTQVEASVAQSVATVAAVQALITHPEPKVKAAPPAAKVAPKVAAPPAPKV